MNFRAVDVEAFLPFWRLSKYQVRYFLKIDCDASNVREMVSKLPQKFCQIAPENVVKALVSNSFPTDKISGKQL